MVSDITFFMIFAVFEVSVIACHRKQAYKLVFCTFIMSHGYFFTCNI